MLYMLLMQLFMMISESKFFNNSLKRFSDIPLLKITTVNVIRPAA